MNKENYKFMVATECLTFNHSNYITDTLQGFAMQTTTFPCVFVIVDDASTDGEQEVLRKWADNNLAIESGSEVAREELSYGERYVAYLKDNPNSLFVVLLLFENHHGKKSKQPYISEWKDNAKYYALCEGDDYWIDSLKLQKQVDYLDNHPEVGLVHARAKIFNQESQMFQGICGERNGLFEQILLKNPIVTLTTCYRSSLLKEYVNESAKWGQRGWKMGDYPMWIWMSKRAGVHFMKDVVAVYRQQNNSVTHSGGLENKLAFIDSTVDIRLFFCDYYKLPQKTKNQVLYNAFLSKAANCLARQEKIQAEAYLKKLTILDRWNLKLRFWFHDVRHILNKQKDA